MIIFTHMTDVGKTFKVDMRLVLGLVVDFALSDLVIH